MTAYKSKVYTQRPAYADFESPMKFEAIKNTAKKYKVEIEEHRPKIGIVQAEIQRIQKE